MTYKPHTNCRVCDSNKLTPYLDLGMMPLSNNLAESTLDPIHNQRYPLTVLLCENCGLSQLSIVIPPEEMFSHYVYRSSINKGYVEHCRKMAQELKYKYNLDEDSTHIDIAGNDGALIEQFKEVIGCYSLNVDPAKNLSGICEAARIPVFAEFWGMDAARKILNGGLLKRQSSKSKEDKYNGRADLITATNVFAHVDDVRDFIRAAKHVLKLSGVLVMEFPYLIDFIENNEFDTVYFEHLSYFSIYPLTILCRDVGFEVLSVEKQDIHGGSVRVTIGYGLPDKSVDDFILREEKYRSIEPYIVFEASVKKTIRSFRDFMHSQKGSIAGFAASAKGNTLLNSCGVTVGSMRYIVDETPEKIGKYSPGTRIPIVSMIDFMRTPPDNLVILSWNFSKEIIKKVRDVGYAGKIVIPIPEIKVIK